MTKAERLIQTLLADGLVSTWTLVDVLKPGSDDVDLLRVHICYLRKRLGPGSIHTIRGKGYELTEAGRKAIEQARAA